MAINYYAESIVTESNKKKFDLTKIKEDVQNIIN
jgi:hypothetical protein